MVRYKMGGYPADYTTGVLAYFGTGTSVTINSLAFGQTYYICVWSYVASGGAEQYSASASLTVRTDPITAPSETIITTFQSGHEFARTSGSANMTDDTSIYFMGSQSLRIDTTSFESEFTRYDISPTIDMSGKVTKVILRVADTTRMNLDSGATIMVYFSSDNFSTNWFRYALTPELVKASPGGYWVTVTRSYSDVSHVYGTVDMSHINAVRLYVRDGGSGPTNIWFQEISSFTPLLPYGIITFTFDDGYAPVATVANPKMSTYGYPGVAYINPDTIGIADMMTWDNVTALQNTFGWDISNHGNPHTDFTIYNSTDLESNLVRATDNLTTHGLKAGNQLAYPFGGFNGNVVLPMTRQYATTARSSLGGHETFPPGDYYILKTLGVYNTTVLSTLEAAVDNAIANKDWLILTMHTISTPADDGLKFPVEYFNSLIDYVQSKSIAVKTITQVMDLLAAASTASAPTVPLPPSAQPPLH